jgi:hypothetical protein
MAKLRDRVDFVVGVDTHKATHTAAVVNPQGAELATTTLPADTHGYRRLREFAQEHAQGRRVWAVEGSGSFGSGLTTHLLAKGEWVVEVDRPRRPARRTGAKSDELDATRAAREALSRNHLAQPRRRGEREALRVLVRTRHGAVQARSRAICHLKSLVVTAHERLRDTFRRLDTTALVNRCARLRTSIRHSPEHRATVTALRATARRVLHLEAEANDLESQIEMLVLEMAAPLLAEPGIGVLTAAEILCAWSHPGRLRSEAAFAALGGVAPIVASSGQVTRHRLNRGGDRRLNCALHTIVLSRLGHHEETQEYAARRTLEGKSRKEIRRCLKRYLARRIYRLLEGLPDAA